MGLRAIYYLLKIYDSVTVANELLQVKRSEVRRHSRVKQLWTLAA